MFFRNLASSHLRLFADLEGRLVLDIWEEGESIRFPFQRLHITGGGRTVIEVTWTAESASLRLNNQEVMLDAQCQKPPFSLITQDDQLAEKGLVFEAIDPSAAKSHYEFMFLSTLQDLDNKLQSGGKYNMIRAAGFLRSLVLDGTPLVHLINKSYRIPLEFEIVDLPRSVQEVVEIADGIGWEALMPGSHLKTSIKVPLADFLGAPCFRSGAHVVTVRDVIRACANSRGAIHFQHPKPSRAGEAQALEWDDTFRLVAVEPTILMLAYICRIILRGLKPLVDAVMEEPPTSSKSL